MHIAVMGVTGAGKSTFIKAATQLEHIGIGHDLYSCKTPSMYYLSPSNTTTDTETVESYSIKYKGPQVTLIDTPGFNDTQQKEGDVLRAIADWLAFHYQNEPRMKLTGIIYLQSIMEPRMTGSSLRNLKMFKQLCGKDPMRNVVLVTTRWGVASKAGQMTLAQQHEEQLATDAKFWGGLIELGARMERYEDSMASAWRIIDSLATHKPLPLQIQTELVDQQKDLIETAAGIAVNEEILKMEAEHKKEIAALHEEIEEAKSEGDAKMQAALERTEYEYERKLDRIRAQHDALQYQQRADSRRTDSNFEDLKRANTLLQDKLSENHLDFDRTVARLEANDSKLRREQREIVRREVEAMKKKPKKERTALNMVLKLLPLVGNVVFMVLGLTGVLPAGGLLGSF